MLDKRDLPRVTYTGAADLEPIHQYLDVQLPEFRRTQLGREWPNIIGAERAWDGRKFDCFSPLDDTLLLGSYHVGTAETIERAVASARKGLKTWRRLTWQERLAHIRKVEAALDNARFDLATALMLEVGKNRVEALGEVEEAVALIRFYAEELEKNEGFITTKKQTEDETVETRMMPVGVFGIISPFNYPCALAVNMMSAALVTGNTVVLKPTPNGALVAGLLAEAVLSAGLPDGVFNLVYGDEAGRLLVDADGIDGIAITGSHEAGMDIVGKFAAGPYMRPVIAELGGKNHTYVDKSADLKLAVNGVARSAFNMQGQRCTATSVVYVHADIYEEFLPQLVARAGEFQYGDTTGRESKVGPLINERAYQRYIGAVEHARARGKVEWGGSRLQGSELERGFFVTPAIVTGLAEDDHLATEEFFAPILVVQRYQDLAQAIATGNRTNFGLAAGFYATDNEQIEFFLSQAEAGSLYVNRVTGATNGAWPGIQVMSGWKGSGLTNKGALGNNYLPQFLREQSRTVRTS